MKALCILLALLGTQQPEVEVFRGVTAPPLPEGTSPRELVSRFVQSDWLTVRQAEWYLESLQEKGVPELLALLDRDEVVKLASTADLIYPGAETFYGHGSMVPYELDYLPARAGWALEEMTFQDFGFQGNAIREETLRQQVQTGEGDVPLSKVVPPETRPRRERFQPAIRKAKAWWRAEGRRWTRLAALRAALDSGDSKRQMQALSWLRFGTTRCDGLSRELFARDLKPKVEKLARSSDPSVRQQAELLVADTGMWWAYKTDPTLRDW